MADREPLGQRLRRARHAAGLSVEELAERSGVSVRGIGDIERGRSRRPQARTLALLAGALGVEIAAPAAGDDLGGRVAGDFVGRAAELAAVERPGGPVVVVTGAPGVGKTTFAAQAARRLAGRYPAGTFLVDLRGLDESPPSAADALGQLLQAFGTAPGEIPAEPADREELYRSVVREKPALIVLDNAAGEPQVRPLLHDDAAALTLVTSRRVLAGLERVRRVHLDTLTEAESADRKSVV